MPGGQRSEGGVVVTGVGVASALGEDPATFWAGLTRGDVAIRPVRFDDGVPGREPVVTTWAPMEGFDPSELLGDRDLEATDRYAQLMAVAAEAARTDAGAGDLDPLRTAVVTATSMGGLLSLADGQAHLERGGVAAVPRKLQLRIWPNMAAGLLTRRWGLHGPTYTVCTACAGSLDAVGLAAGLLRAGLADAAVVAAGDAQLGPLIVGNAAVLGAGSPCADPLRASLPFDRDRSGMVVGEGGGAVVLETEEHARRRGAAVLGRILGYGSLADAHHPSSPDPSGRWEARAVELALDQAGRSPADIAGVVAHATATVVGDAAEIRALNAVFDGAAAGLPVTSLKGHLGHASGTAGMLGVVAAVLALGAGELPPVAGTTVPDPEVRFDVALGSPVSLRGGDAVLVDAFGFGGQNASVVVGAP